jgi:putative SOS response-associated peptidase YedK
MCGRYLLDTDVSYLYERYNIPNTDIEFKPSKEIFPSNVVPIVTYRELKLMKWGFEAPYLKRPVINARAETIEIKPMFRNLFINKRCIIPATGFYEWKKSEGKKIKHKISFEDRRVFSMAGLYNDYIDKNGDKTTMFTIITTTPNGVYPICRT